jgi:hypothetical protein
VGGLIEEDAAVEGAEAVVFEVLENALIVVVVSAVGYKAPTSQGAGLEAYRAYLSHLRRVAALDVLAEILLNRVAGLEFHVEEVEYV